MRSLGLKLLFELSHFPFLLLPKRAIVPVYLVVLPLLLRASSPVEQRQLSIEYLLRSRACWVSSTGTNAPEPIRASLLYQLDVRIRVH